MTRKVLPKVLQNFEKTPKCTLWPKELNQKGFPCNIQYRTRPKGPPLDFFRHCATFVQKSFSTKVSPLQFFWSFATEWMLKNPKGSFLSVVFGIVRLLKKYFHKRFQIHQYFNIFKSFCYFWALDMAPTSDRSWLVFFGHINDQKHSETIYIF